ncbi:MAG TPA: hypothetical protein VNM87_06840, partial [Candidatus Udaeobacter sp.]|nr:hypothetical protein [Candidatus Udaeobacter sp.]
DADGELHALLPMSQLDEVGEAIDTWGVPVTEGADLLASAAAVSRPAPKVAPEPMVAPEAAPPRSRVSVGGVLFGLSLLVTIGGAAFFGWRTLSHEEITLARSISRAAAPPAGGTWAAIQRWALARDVSIPLRQVLFLGESKLVLADGSFVAIEGAGDLRRLLPLAQAEQTEPVIETASWPPSPAGKFAGLPVDRIRCGKVIFSRGGTLRPLAILTPSTHGPQRSLRRESDGFWVVNDLRYDDGRRLLRLAGQRLSVGGRVTTEGPDRVLRLENGTGVLLAPLPAGSRVEPLIAGLAGDGTAVQVDLVFERMLPWRNAKYPDASRQETKIAGVGRVVSVSVESLFVTDRD